MQEDTGMVNVLVYVFQRKKQIHPTFATSGILRSVQWGPAGREWGNDSDTVENSRKGEELQSGKALKQF
jgi:hypothetical protein